MKVLVLKSISLGLTVIGGVLGIFSHVVDDKKLEAIVDRTVNNKLAEKEEGKEDDSENEENGES